MLFFSSFLLCIFGNQVLGACSKSDHPSYGSCEDTSGEENAKAKIVKEALRQKRGRSPRKNALHVSMQTSQADISNMHRMSRKGEEGDALGNQSKRKEQDKHQLQMHTHIECVS